jgi:hypothetical protein
MSLEGKLSLLQGRRSADRVSVADKMQRGLGCKCAGYLGAPGLALAYLTTNTKPLFLAHIPITYSSDKAAAARGASCGGISCSIPVPAPINNISQTSS